MHFPDRWCVLTLYVYATDITPGEINMFAVSHDVRFSFKTCQVVRLRVEVRHGLREVRHGATTTYVRRGGLASIKRLRAP